MMDFPKQCRRFINYNLINEERFKRKLTNISAIGILKSTANKSINKSFDNAVLDPPAPIITYKIVVADNDENSLILINESDGKISKEKKDLDFLTYSLCCTKMANKNFIYLSDFVHNMVRKFDENLNEVKQLKPPSGVQNFDGPCGISINHELNRLVVVDQKNLRIVSFDLTNDEYLSEFKLFDEDLKSATKYAKPTSHDLSSRLPLHNHLENIRTKEKLDFWPFGINTRGERIYVTDWNRGLLYIYKSNLLEVKIGYTGSKKFLSKPRDVVLDSNGFLLVSDIDQDKFFILDNKGNYLFETKAPKIKKYKNEEKGIFGLTNIDNKLVFASNMCVYICNLLG
jgi:hypothetical protein